MNQNVANWSRLRELAFAFFLAGASQLSTKRHSVRDYQFLIALLIYKHGYDKAMELGVGGQWSKVGELEFLLLEFLGLRSGDFIMDIGCGSGRLASFIASRNIDVSYHGTDVVREFIRNAKRVSPKHFRYTRVTELTIPERDDTADYVTFFSVATHLQLHETYIYLQEARRVAKPGGAIIVSFLDIGNPAHRAIFRGTAEAAKKKRLLHLNMFFDASAIRHMAEDLGLDVEGIFPGDLPFIPTDRGLEKFDQSVAVLRKKVG